MFNMYIKIYMVYIYKACGPYVIMYLFCGRLLRCDEYQHASLGAALGRNTKPVGPDSMREYARPLKLR